MSFAELRENFLCAEVRDYVVFAHTKAALASTMQKSLCWYLRDTLCFRHQSWSSISSFDLDLANDYAGNLNAVYSTCKTQNTRLVIAKLQSKNCQVQVYKYRDLSDHFVGHGI